MKKLIILVALVTFALSPVEVSASITSNIEASGQMAEYLKPPKKRYGVRKQPKFRSCRSAAKVRNRRRR
ncbi:MAG: hypothetical protein R3B39_01045 [Candidatus Paceibacterota bacterium]